MDLKYIEAGVLEIAYFEAGPSDGPAVILLHGFPYDAILIWTSLRAWLKKG